MAKRVSTRRIRSNRSYDVCEAAKTCRVTPWTVRNWVKAGLPVLDGPRPTLIAGEALKAFLKARQEKAKCTLKSGDLYCTSCKAATHPLEGKFDVKRYGNRLAVQARCSWCERLCSRFVNAAQLTGFAKTVATQSLTAVTAKGTPKPLLKTITGGRLS